uniref:CXXC-type domain-containing protein n=1 Tax=Xiphophorus couchianus TaxID=32473 RepID=A0A3B5LQB6_9TELE
MSEEGWVEWPVLGQGWKRKEVVRRSGSSIGQKDVYYLRYVLTSSCFSFNCVVVFIIYKIKQTNNTFVCFLFFLDCQWIPCGQCVGCHNAIDCGQCANCKHGLQSPEARKRLCRKRRCICPIRKWHKKRKRRSCGECKACLCRKDCGVCDFCIDKPKFGGSNKKRQKCRLRQCQRQAMVRHLFNEAIVRFCTGCLRVLKKSCIHISKMKALIYAPLLPGRPRPHYTYSRKSSLKRSQDQQADMDYTDDDDDDDEDSNPQPITQIFSLAENPAESGMDLENQLMKLLHALRSSVLPILWYAIMVEGPQLQLIQCSKQSNMADTMVLIDPGFCYQVTVQKQPLLPIHPLYDIHPSRLGTATDVVSLLLSLERFVVCQGLTTKQSLFDKGPIVLERAATCDFLIKKNERTCASCKALQELQIHHRE